MYSHCEHIVVRCLWTILYGTDGLFGFTYYHYDLGVPNVIITACGG